MLGGKQNHIYVKKISNIQDKNSPKYILCNIIEDSEDLKDYRLFTLITEKLKSIKNFNLYKFLNKDGWVDKVNINIDHQYYFSLTRDDKYSFIFDKNMKYRDKLTEEMKDRIRGCIYGQFIGDALGAAYEFKSRDTVAKKMSMNRHENGRLKVTDGVYGAMKGYPGIVTDDTEMAVGLMYSLRKLKKYNVKDVFSRYHDWYKSGPFDIGGVTYNALYDGNSANNGFPNSSANLSNGCLMRISPLAVFGAGLTDKELFDACELDTKITNNNYYAINCVQIFCKAVKHLILTADKVDTFNQCYKLANKIINRDEISEKGWKYVDRPIVHKDALIENMVDSLNNNSEVKLKVRSYVKKNRHRIPKGRIQIDKNKREVSDFSFIDVISTGNPAIAMQLGFFELLNGTRFDESLERVIAQGGDTDTNAAIVGALLGAYYGAKRLQKDAPEWVQQIINMDKHPRYNGSLNHYKYILTQIETDIHIDELIDVINEKL